MFNVPQLNNNIETAEGVDGPLCRENREKRAVEGRLILFVPAHTMRHHHQTRLNGTWKTSLHEIRLIYFFC